MGVTYKAVDVNLHCPVTLKSSARDISVTVSRLRFLREARAALASVTQMLSGCSTWEGPGAVFFTRWSLWREKRSRISSNTQVGLEVKLALEIATQVAAGLAAVRQAEARA